MAEEIEVTSEIVKEIISPLARLIQMQSREIISLVTNLKKAIEIDNGEVGVNELTLGRIDDKCCDIYHKYSVGYQGCSFRKFDDIIDYLQTKKDIIIADEVNLGELEL